MAQDWIQVFLRELRQRLLASILAKKGLSVFYVITAFSSAESWHKNAYQRRRRARRAAEQPYKHPRGRLVAAAQVLNRHHGSTIPLKLSAAIMAPKKFICTGCKWEVSGKTAAKTCKERGNCGEPWCPLAISPNTVRQQKDRPKAVLKAAADVPRPTVKVQMNDTRVQTTARLVARMMMTMMMMMTRLKSRLRHRVVTLFRRKRQIWQSIVAKKPLSLKS